MPEITVPLQIYANVGVLDNSSPNASMQVYSNVDDAVGVDPTVYGTNPIRARNGDSVYVIGVGFGTTQVEYSGIIQGQDNLGNWSDLTPLSWEHVPATVDGLGVDRIIDTGMTQINVEHQRIQVEVPGWADPPNLPVRVVTNGA